jgi:catechol 2,3-dioxygenase-like lactoylglutathione lyase family enzyme
MSGERVRDLIPFVHVADIARSIDFYELLGFELKDTHEYAGRLDWAALDSGDAQLMLARASAPIEHDRQAVLFYLYNENLAALRDPPARKWRRGRRDRRRQPPPRARDGPRRSRRLVPDGRRDRAALLVAAPDAQAYDPARARLTLTRRQIPAALSAHVRRRASAALPVC